MPHNAREQLRAKALAHSANEIEILNDFFRGSHQRPRGDYADSKKSSINSTVMRVTYISFWRHSDVLQIRAEWCRVERSRFSFCVCLRLGYME